MADIRSVRMGDEERDEFLGRGGTGTISVSTPDDDPPYSRPVSYGYDAETGNFYFRFAVGPEDTGKADIVDQDSVVSFVTHNQTDDGWRSVVATGRLAVLPMFSGTVRDIGQIFGEHVACKWK